jgi:hypothetical protein
MTTPVSTTSTSWADDDHAAVANDGNGAACEPFVPVPAGQIGEAIELLAVAHELIAMHASCCVNIRLQDLLREHGIDGTYQAYTRLRAGFGRTAAELADSLAETGVTVDAIWLPTHEGRIRR